MPNISEKTPSLSPDSLMPVLFIGHGSPMNALDDNAFSRNWAHAAADLPRPRAILCLSAHWETADVAVTAIARPRTIHDFRGFPEALSRLTYSPPGSPKLAERVRELVPAVRLDTTWGLDHGAWSVLCRMFPAADIPTIQLSLCREQTPAFHFALGAALKPLRREGVLILGSGNIVHNLAALAGQDTVLPWAREFDERVAGLIEARDFAALTDYPSLGPAARLAVPTPEHFLPLLVVLGAADANESLAFFNQAVILGAIGMRSVRIG